MSEQEEVRALYQRLIGRWNHHDAAGMAALFADDGSQIGFDVSMINKRSREPAAWLAASFVKHPTPPFVWKVREVRGLGEDDMALAQTPASAWSPPVASFINPALTVIQTLMVVAGLAGRTGAPPCSRTPR